jgi:hypothetical protein
MAEYHAPLPDVAPDALRAAMASRDATAYVANDVLFGYAVTNGKHRLVVLNLGSNTVNAVDLPDTAVKAATLVAASKDDDVVPVVVQCTGRGAGTADGAKCEAHVVVVAGAAVGQRERVVVVEIGSSWLVVGVAPGSVNLLQQMPRAEMPAAAAAAPLPSTAFAAWLKQVMEKRNDK